MRRAAALGLVLAAGLGLGACSTLPLENRPLERYDPDGGYRFSNIAPGENNSDSLFLILTFSGGGTRAAAFAYGALEKLRDTEIVWEGRRRRLLDEVDIISSVSGGSLAAAYYGAFGDRIFEDFLDQVLYKDLQKMLIRQVLALRNYVKLASPFYGRTDLLADQFDHGIFEETTFANLLERNRRPFVVINATDVSLGSRFEFTQRQFDLLYSDLGSYPLGHAVAASAAFPGLLTPVTLRNYEKGSDYQPPPWIAEELKRADPRRARHSIAIEQQSYLSGERPFIHLVDGGVSDNLGVLPVVQFLNGAVPNDWMAPALQNHTVRKIAIITVNAARAGKTAWDRRRNAIDLFNLLYAVTAAPVGNYTEAELALLRAYLEQNAERQRIRREVVRLLGEEAANALTPELDMPGVKCYFIEVAFDWVADETTREALNSIGTSFRLGREKVDLLRHAAREILDNHPDFRDFLTSLNATPKSGGAQAKE